MRIRGISEETGEAIPQLDGLVKRLTGVDMMKDKNTFKSTYDIMVEISKVWKDIEDVDRAALLDKLFGKHQGAVGASILNNMADGISAMETATNSFGSSAKEQAAYMESLQARTNEFSETLSKIYINAINTESIKDIVSSGTDLLNTIDRIITGLGGLNTALLLVSTGSLITFASSLYAIPVGASVAKGGLDLLTASAARLNTALLAFLGHPATWLIATLVAIPIGIMAWTNHQQKLKQQIEETNKSVSTFNKTLNEFDKTLDKSKISQLASDLEQVKRAVDFESATKRIKELEDAIKYLELNPLKNYDPEAIPTMIKELEKLKNQISPVVEAEQKLAQAIEDSEKPMTNQNGLLVLNEEVLKRLSALKDEESQKELKRINAELVAQTNTWNEKLKIYDMEIQKLESLAQAKYYALLAVGSGDVGITASAYGQELYSLKEQNDKWNRIFNPDMGLPFSLDDPSGGSSTSPKISTFNLYESSLKRINDELSILKDKLESDPSLQAEINLKLNFKKDLIEREKVEIENALKEAYKELESINKDYADRIRRGDDVSDLVIINNEALANAIDNVLKLKSVHGDLEKALWDVGKEFTSLSQQLEKIYGNQLSSISSNISKAITSIQDQIKDIESSYDSIIEKKKEELELLERQYEAEDRILKLKELDQQISDTLADRRFEFITSEGELIYTYDKKKYEDLIDERQKLLDEYKRKDLIQAKKDEIQGLEDAKRREVQIYKDRITDMQNFQTELKNLQDLELQGLKDNINAKVEELKRYKDMWAIYASEILTIQNGINNMNIPSPSGGSASSGGSSSSSGSTSSDRDPSKITVTNPNTGTQFYIKDGTEDNYKGYILSGGGYAKGTTSATPGIHPVGEDGVELRVLNKGDGIIPSQITKNLWKLGQPNIMDRMMNLVKAPSYNVVNNNNIPSQPSKTYQFNNVTIKANNPMEFLKGIDNLIMSQG